MTGLLVMSIIGVARSLYLVGKGGGVTTGYAATSCLKGEGATFCLQGEVASGVQGVVRGGGTGVEGGRARWSPQR